MSANNYYQHPQAVVETSKVGQGTRIWAFVHILPGAVIGEDCNICDHIFIENDVLIGNRVTIKSGVQVWDGITLEDDVFVGPNATFTNDRFPRSKQHPDEVIRTVVRTGASIGANATILPGLEIGRCAMVGAGAVVTKNVPPHAIVVGNPARIMGYETNRQPTSAPIQIDGAGASSEIGVRGVKVIELPLVEDLRGNLSYAQFPDQLPFTPKRYFLVFDVANKEIRGEHAHHTLKQFLVCIKGTCSIMVDDGAQRAEITLNRPNLGLYIPPLVWGVQYKYSPETVLLVLASDIYQADDYIRDYEQFLALVNSKP
jgi:UDP-2-acetamido-3-amino-2,3-dideoxy-glucuronate N-acetyltransferase